MRRRESFLFCAIVDFCVIVDFEKKRKKKDYFLFLSLCLVFRVTCPVLSCLVCLSKTVRFVYLLSVFDFLVLIWNILVLFWFGRASGTVCWSLRLLVVVLPVGPCLVSVKVVHWSIWHISIRTHRLYFLPWAIYNNSRY